MWSVSSSGENRTPRLQRKQVPSLSEPHALSPRNAFKAQIVKALLREAVLELQGAGTDSYSSL